MTIARVLVVDDEEQVCKLVQQMLEKSGYKVMAASGGAEAIALYQKHSDSIDVLIMDLKMQDMTGVEAFEALRHLGCKVPAILSSGYTEDEIRQYADRGFVGFIKKPYQKESLKKLLLQVLA